MKPKITAVICHSGDKRALERTIRSVSGWTSEITLFRRGKKTGKKNISGWVLGLNSGEEVSIPLKREIRELLNGFHEVSRDVRPDSYSIPVIRNARDNWKTVCPGSTRLVLGGGKGVTGHLKNPLRDYIDYKVFPGILEGVKVKRALVLKLRGLGDTVLLTPLFKAVRKAFPGVLTDAVVKPESATLLEGQRYISSPIAYEGFFKTLFKLRKKKYDIALVAQAGFSTALLARLSGAKILSVNNHNGRNYFSSARVAKPREYENASERDLDCLRALGVKASFSKPEISVSVAEREKALRFLAKAGAGKNKAVIINPSASKNNKMWPVERFAAFIDRISIRNGVKPFVLTDPANPEVSAGTVLLSKSGPVLLPSMSLRQVLGLVSVSSLYIGNDSGLSHAAAALGTPTITIVGPDEPSIFHPYRSEDGHYLVSKDRYCKPCWKKECAGRECLEAVSPADVYKEYLKWRK